MTSPAGPLSLAAEYFRTALADSTAARTWLDADNQAEALARIHHHGLPGPANGREYTLAELQTYRPYAVVFAAEQNGFRATLEAAGDGFEYQRAGRLVARLYQNCPDALTDEPSSDANLQWSNTIGQIIEDLLASSGKAGYLAFTALAVTAGPFWNHPKAAPAQGVWQGVELAVDWTGL
jgi:hypothetical protein